VFDPAMIDSLRRHEGSVMQAWRDAQLPEETVIRPAGGGGGGGGSLPITAKVVAIQTLTIACKLVDPHTQEPLGDQFDVWPWVEDKDGPTDDYDLTETTGDRVVSEVPGVGKMIRIYSATHNVGENDPEQQWWTLKSYHIPCPPEEEPPP
jgi:hypothetical protein